MSKEKKGALAVRKEKKTVPAVKEPESETIQDFNQMLDTLRSAARAARRLNQPRSARAADAFINYFSLESNGDL